MSLLWIWPILRRGGASGCWHNLGICLRQMVFGVCQTLSLPGLLKAEGLTFALRTYQMLSRPGWQRDLHPAALLPEDSSACQEPLRSHLQWLLAGRASSRRVDNYGSMLSRANDTSRYDISPTVIVGLMSLLTKRVSD